MPDRAVPPLGDPLGPPSDPPRPPFGDGPRLQFGDGPPRFPGARPGPPFDVGPLPPAFVPPPRPDRVPELGLAPFLHAMADWTRVENGSCLVIDRVDYVVGEDRVESTVGPVFGVIPWLVPPDRR